MPTTPKRNAGVAVAAIAALAVLVPSGAAHAESTTVHDGADATGSPTDIHDVTVRHGPAQLRVHATFADLRKHNGGTSEAVVFIDTDAGRKGPEFALSTGLEHGTDYQLVRVRNWWPRGGPMSCDHKVRLKYAKDVAKFRISRGCLGDPGRVRVGMRMVDRSDGSHVITDWMKGKRRFTRWLVAG